MIRWWIPTFLTAAAARRNRKAGMVSPKIYYFDPADLIWWAGGTYSPWVGIPQHLGRRTTPDNSTIPARSRLGYRLCALAAQCGIASDGTVRRAVFGNGEDLDLSLRMRKLGYIVTYVPTARVWHRKGSTTRRMSENTPGVLL